MATEVPAAVPAAVPTSNQQRQDSDSKWDIFKETNEKGKEISGKQWTKIIHCAKNMIALVLFIIVLCLAVCSKGALLTLTSNMFRPGHRMVNPLKTWNGHLKYQAQRKNETVYESENAVTNVCYIWAVFMVVVTPYIGTVLFFCWKVIIKGCSKHTETTAKKDTTFQWRTVLAVELLLASIHTIGLSIFVFSLLPAMDPVSGLWYCCSVGVVPAICQLIRYVHGLCAETGSERTLRRTIMFAILPCFSIASIALWGILYWSVGSVQSTGQLVLFILSPFMVSIGWLENYIPDGIPNCAANNTSGTYSSKQNGTVTSVDKIEEATYEECNPKHQEGRDNNATEHGSVGIGCTSHNVVPTDADILFDRAPRSKVERAADIGRGAEREQNDIEQYPQQQKQLDVNRENQSPIKFLEWLKIYKAQVHKERYNIFLITNILKTMLTFLMVLVIYVFDSGDIRGCMQTLFGIRNVAVMNSSMFGSTLLDGRIDTAPFLISIVGLLASFFCHRFCVFAIKATLQWQCFSIPMLMCTPVSCCLVFLFLHVIDDSSFPFPTVDGSLNIERWMIGASLLGYSFLIAITVPNMTNKIERMTPERRIFFIPGYCGAFSDQSLLLNRWLKPQEHNPYKINNDREESSLSSTHDIGSNTGVTAAEVNTCSIEQTGNDNTRNSKLDEATNKTCDRVRQDDDVDKNVPSSDGNGSPFVYLCATMWHENKKEMTKLLTSIFRLDKDQFMKKVASQEFNIHTDILDMEVNIFFDDAFMPSEQIHTGKPLCNEYVETFMEVVNEAKSTVYPHKFSIKRPVSRETPYGMQLEYTLPCGHKLRVHLKDKKKIRVKKRWSQVMYMYYLLSYKPGTTSTGDGDRVPKLDDIYILALDGDVDFQPKALYLLVERMKKNVDVGAACGRIHPIGSGWMIWYQVFEYAVSHWLQKATEHVTGCVLCSPGCFSLFRGSALAENNVAKRYTTVSSDPRHYIQYDQGEDRWLCTLLLKQGNKVEYIAASDAYTYAPEGFKEFFIQRRRWGPSTMANIMDLLADWRVLTNMNKNISVLYMAYHLFLFATSVLTPGAIFLMILGAFTLAYPALSLPMLLAVSVAPVALFVLVCLKAQSDTQLNMAAILSVMYTILMMVVIVGLIRQSAQNGFCSVTTIFMIYVGGVFILTAIFHPMECGALLHGFMYFLAIPSMSMLLIIYAIVNLNNVSWGTREGSNPTKETAGTTGSTAESNIVARTLKRMGCMCCNLTEELVARLERLEYGVNNRQVNVNSRRTDSDQASVKVIANIKNTQMVDPPANILISKTTQGHSLSTEETEFWNWLIDTYLNPMTGEKRPNRRAANEENTHRNTRENTVITVKRQDTTDSRGACSTIEDSQDVSVEIVETKDELIMKEDKMKKELLTLRNDMVLKFLLLNVLFVTIIYFLQQVNADTKGSVSIPLPCENGESIEPIGMAFTGIFGILLAIQFLCMVAHRFKTLLETISSSDIQDEKVTEKVTDIMNQFANTHQESENAEDLKQQIKNDMRQVNEEQLKIRQLAARQSTDRAVNVGKPPATIHTSNVGHGMAYTAAPTPNERVGSFLDYLTPRQRTKFLNDHHNVRIRIDRYGYHDVVHYYKQTRNTASANLNTAGKQ